MAVFILLTNVSLSLFCISEKNDHEHKSNNPKSKANASIVSSRVNPVIFIN
ncbi:hypothetical protein LEG80045_12910 [Legionella pneumophila]|nr:hypothetical protein LEG80045_12910 [Legionella pneumophila]